MKKKLLAYLLSAAMVLAPLQMAPVQAAELPAETVTGTADEPQASEETKTEEESTGDMPESEPASKPEGEPETTTKPETEPETAARQETQQEETTQPQETTEPETQDGTEPETGTEGETETEEAAGTEEDIKYISEDDFDKYPNYVIPFEIDGTDVFAGLKTEEGFNKADQLPAKYDPRVTAPAQMTKVKNQNPWGTCWAHAMMDILQSSMIRQGLADNTIDLSERHMAYFVMHTGNDALDNSNDDSVVSTPAHAYLDRGGNAYYAAARLMNWQGGAAESLYPYSNASSVPAAIPASAAQDKSVIAKNIYFIPTKDASIEERKTAVKQLIQKYGTVEWSYGHIDSMYNAGKAAYYNPTTGTNHEIVIVGWDDDFPKTNFNKVTVKYSDGTTKTFDTPENNGAWIVKNSWGTSYGDQGYIYISYEDASLGSGNPATVAEAAAKDSYDNNYFYGNVSNASWTTTIPSGGKAAQIYRAAGDMASEDLKAVSMFLSSDNVRYSIQIYKNPASDDPETGERMLSAPVTGQTGYAGLYTIDIKPSVKFSHGDTVAVVITFPEGCKIYLDKSKSDSGNLATSLTPSTYTVEYTNITHAGQSLYTAGEYYSWSDRHENACNFRINMLTNNVSGGSGDEKYTVRFYDSDGEKVKEQLVEKGQDAAPPFLYKRGYELTWDKDYTNITKDTDIYAVFTPIVYSISYFDDSDNSPIDGYPNPETYTIEDTPVKLQPVKKSGYQFYAWLMVYVEEEGKQQVPEIPKNSIGDKSLYASFVKGGGTKVHIRFLDHDGSLIEEQTIERGGNAIPPEAPVRKGYKFKEWDKPLSYITADTVFYAEYELEEYEIKYYDSLENRLIDPGQNHPDNPASYTIETETIELKSVEKEGYVFMGWLRRDKGVLATRIEQGSTGSIELWAQWGRDSGTLITPEIYPKSGILEEGTRITIISNQDAEIYYTIDGSVPSKTNGTKYSGSFELKKSKNKITVRAVAFRGIETSSTVSAVYQYRQTELILEEVEKTMKAGETYTIKVMQFPTGCIPENTQWSSSDEKIATISGKGGQCEVKAAAPGKVIITARAANDKGEVAEASVEVTVGVSEYTVRFLDADGALLKEQKAEQGSAAQPPVPPEIPGYEFVRWEGGDYEDVNSDLTLRAEYELATYSITYDLGGGEAPEGNPSTYTIKSETIILKNPVKHKSFFRGWYNEKTFTGEPVTEITKGSTGDITLYAKWFEPGGLWMEDIAPQTYTGSAVKPQDILVYDTDVLLKEGVDYTVSYKNNVKAYGSAAGITDEKKAPVVIVKGKGNYSGTVSRNFEICPVDLNDSSVQADDIAAACRPGRSQTPAPVVTWNGKKLAAKKDYDIMAPSGCSEPGTYEFTIAGKGNFTGQRTLKFTIASENQKPISAVKAAKIPDQPYGKSVTVTEGMLGLKDGSYMLKMGKDYTVDTAKYTDAGTHSIIVRGKGATYIGTRRISFKIKGTAIKTAKVDSWGRTEFMFDGSEQRPKPVLKANGETLKENKDYIITGYENNRNAGTAKMFISGKGAYSGTAALGFRIKPASVDDSRLTVKFANGSNRQQYEKGGTKPRLLVSFNGTLLNEGTDYTVSYKNNAAYPQKPGKEPAVIVTGRRNLTGKKSQTFSITGKKLSDAGLIFAPDVTESTKPGKFYSTPQVFDTNGNKLTPGTDYKKELVYKSKTGKVLGKTDTAKAGDRITIELTGTGAYEGTHKCTYRILPAGQDIGKAKVKLLRKFSYTGEEITIGNNDLEVSVGGSQLTLGNNYEIEPFPGNPMKGKLRFLLKGKGTYGGSKTITVNVKAQGLKWWSK